MQGGGPDDEAAEAKKSSTRILEQLEEEEDQEHQAKMLQEAMTAVPEMDEEQGWYIRTRHQRNFGNAINGNLFLDSSSEEQGSLQ